MQIVTCRDDVDVDALLKEHGLAPTHRYRYALNGFAAGIPPGIVEKLRRDNRVLAVEADDIATLCDQTIPTGITRIGADVFAVGHSNAPLNVDVAVLDSGIDTNHEDLKHADGSSVVYTNYWAFGTDGSDSLGHGTAVCGVIAAQDNAIGVVGVAPGVRIWNIKCIGPAPYNTWSDVIAGMNFATANSNAISVANISINSASTGAPFRSIAAAVRRMVGAGIVVVVSAGNSGWDMAGPDGVYGTGDDALPASLPEAMAVSAMDPTTDTIAPWSNFSQIPRTNAAYIVAGTGNFVLSSGGTIDVAAPGVNILTTLTNNSYGQVSGTSLAAPYVTGLVALYIATHGRATNNWDVFKIRQVIVDNGLPQSLWRTNNTWDPDTNHEPLAVASFLAQILANPAPQILSQPASQSVALGGSVGFTVNAWGSGLTYQWLFNGTNLSDNARISGSATSTLVIANPTQDDIGIYQVVITNTFGSITSTAANLTTNVIEAHIGNLVQDGSFEIPGGYVSLVADQYYDGVWLLESTDGSSVGFTTGSSGEAASPSIVYPILATAGQWYLNLSGDWSPPAPGASVIRQDLATALSANTNYCLSFLESGCAFYSYPSLVTVSIAPTGTTNDVFSQTFSGRAAAEWILQQAKFTVPTTGLYTLRLKSYNGYMALVDDVAIVPAAATTTSPPVFQTFSRAGNSFVLTWSAVASHSYQLQYKTNLNQPDWINLGSAVPATNTTVSATDTLGSDPQRFYRVMQGP